MAILKYIREVSYLIDLYKGIHLIPLLTPFFLSCKFLFTTCIKFQNQLSIIIIVSFAMESFRYIKLGTFE